MSRSMETRVARLRGSREAEEPGARGIERVARNPECLRLRAVTIAGITPATAATDILGMPDREGQSPFALTLGQRFERRLIENGAANLLALYRDRGRLTITDAKIVNVEDLAPGSGLRARRQRETETRRILQAKLQGDPGAPNLVIKPRLAVRLVDVPHPIEPDYLVASDGDHFYRVGELKSYADRDGKTEPADIRSACRQAAVGVIALRQAIASFGVGDPEQVAGAGCDLILKAPGSFTPTLRAMTIAGEVASLERALSEAPRNLDELEAMLPLGATLSDAGVLAAVPNNYRPGCKEHCAMWQHCREQALATGHPVVLGDQAAEQLAAAGSIARALDLLNGVGLPPRTPAEAMLAAQLREADTILQRAVANG